MGSVPALCVGAIDDHPIALAGLTQGLRWYLSTAVVDPVARTVQEFLAADTRQVRVVLLDLQLDDGSDPAENVEALTRHGWPVLMFTQDQRHGALTRCLQAGASGILAKGEDLATIATAVTTVLRGEPYLSPTWAAVMSQDRGWVEPNLTPRESEAVRLYAAGLKLSSVARRLGVSDDTTRTYLLRARGKYSDAGRPAPTKTDLYIRAVEDGLLPAPGVGG